MVCRAGIKLRWAGIPRRQGVRKTLGKSAARLLPPQASKYLSTSAPGDSQQPLWGLSAADWKDRKNDLETLCMLTMKTNLETLLETVFKKCDLNQKGKFTMKELLQAVRRFPEVGMFLGLSDSSALADVKKWFKETWYKEIDFRYEFFVRFEDLKAHYIHKLDAANHHRFMSFEEWKARYMKKEPTQPATDAAPMQRRSTFVLPAEGKPAAEEAGEQPAALFRAPSGDVPSLSAAEAAKETDEAAESATAGPAAAEPAATVAATAEPAAAEPAVAELAAAEPAASAAAKPAEPAAGDLPAEACAVEARRPPVRHLVRRRVDSARTLHMNGRRVEPASYSSSPSWLDSSWSALLGFADSLSIDLHPWHGHA